MMHILPNRISPHPSNAKIHSIALSSSVHPTRTLTLCLETHFCADFDILGHCSDGRSNHRPLKKKKVLNTHQAAFGYTIKLRGPVIF